EVGPVPEERDLHESWREGSSLRNRLHRVVARGESIELERALPVGDLVPAIGADRDAGQARGAVEDTPGEGEEGAARLEGAEVRTGPDRAFDSALVPGRGGVRVSGIDRGTAAERDHPGCA